jgi:hypothetical protein
MRAPKPNPRQIPADLRPDALIDNAVTHWSASKNAAYRQRVIDRFTTCLRFFQEHGLARRELLPDGTTATPQTTIRRSDLTDEGFAFAWAYYDEWLRYLDRQRPIDDAFLLVCLQQFRRNA